MGYLSAQALSAIMCMGCHKRTTRRTDDKPVKRHVSADTLDSLACRLGVSGRPVPAVDLSDTASRWAGRAFSCYDPDDPRPCWLASVARCLLHLGSTHRRSTRLEESITGHMVEIPNRIRTTKRAEREKVRCCCWTP
jgi:hypothetical protein